MTHLSGEHDHYARLVAEGARLVFVNGALDSLDVPSVGVDERYAGQLAAPDRAGPPADRVRRGADGDYLPTREKAAGRRDALRAAGLDGDRLVAHGHFSPDGGRAALGDLLDRAGERPTGVICSSDLMAVGVLHEARSRGLKVPDDLSVVGFDGIAAADWVEPRLTTIEQPIDEIAETAVRALLTLIEEPGRELPSYLFRPKLRERASTGPPPA